MKHIKAIVDTFSEEEAREFLLFQQKKNRRGDTKNEVLFNLIVHGETKNLDEKVYGSPAKNKYHALCKRLQDSLIDFMATKSFSGETSQEMDILKLLLAARILFEYKQYKTAFKTLAQAEKKATALDVYAILTEIYHTKIQYAHLDPSIDLAEVKQKCLDNLQHFQQEQHLNIIYATIKQQLQGPSDASVDQVIEKAFKDFASTVDSSLTYKTLFQLLQLTATAAKLQTDYYSTLPYMEQLYALVSAKKEPTKKHLFYYIQILYLMALAHFRNKNFEKASGFLNEMETAMQHKNKMYHNRFAEKLITLKGVNLNYRGKAPQAIALLEEHKEHSLDIALSLLMMYFQQKEYTRAFQILRNLNHSDIWYEKKMGWLWVLKKSIIEILLLIELDKLDLVLSRLQSFQKKFNKKLKSLGETRVLNFIKLVAFYYEKPQEVTTKAFYDKVENSFEWIGKEREDIFVMSFYAWLKAKMEQRDLYEVTLELVQK
ncbi:hypothetical protein [Marinirhabdus gelatinilytica]|uniref:Uncharacterized protein n=1 Tax=Marinirhabdus gelatinilytica TaxID=1703343 RepID=A0A370Q7J1_9FLAO|nr:hypothetical protein [Marinirhabdus gelatinilytica]RDK84331.1 hypothetical protein C8D94_105177 [Marinirhabdus gelatinilytica]